MRVLYLNQTAVVSGAERSLLDLLHGLGGRVEPVLACPAGELAEAAVELGVRWEPIAGTKASFRLHPVHTGRGLLDIAHSAVTVAALQRRLAPAIVHANTTRASLLALAPAPGRAPLVAHIRDWVPAGRLPRAVHRVIGRRADLVLANSAYVARQFDGIRLKRPVAVVHNPVDLSRFSPDPEAGAAVRRQLGLRSDARVVSVVAQITPWKGQDDAIRAIAAVPGAELLIVGSAKFGGPGVRYDNPAFERSLHRLAAELGVAERVHFLGERDDVAAVLTASDLLLLSSWREAFGRIAIEAMAVEVPVVAVEEGGPAEIVEPAVSGILVPPRRPDLWAARIGALLGDPEARRRMGARARERAQDFSLEAHASAVLALYRDLSRAF